MLKLRKAITSNFGKAAALIVAIASAATVLYFGRGKVALTAEEQARLREPHYYVELRTGMCFHGRTDILMDPNAKVVSCEEIRDQLSPGDRSILDGKIKINLPKVLGLE